MRISYSGGSKSVPAIKKQIQKKVQGVLFHNSRCDPLIFKIILNARHKKIVMPPGTGLPDNGLDCFS